MILAIDQGSQESGWCEMGMDGLFTGKCSNENILVKIASLNDFDVLVLERFACYGMTIGQEVIDAIEWGGQFIHAASMGGAEVVRLFRRQVKIAVTGSPKANDSAIRCAILDRFGGKEKAVGTKHSPGPLYGVKSDAWSALALALTFREESETDFRA